MENNADEHEVIPPEPARRTRSTRTVKGKSVAAKPSVRRTSRKKVAQIEAESDEEHQQQNLLNESNESDADEAVNAAITTEEEAALLEDNNATDIVTEEVEDVPFEAEVHQFPEDSNSVTNDFNSFKGAASSSEHMGEDTNSFDIEPASGDGNGEVDTNLKEEIVDNGEQQQTETEGDNEDAETVETEEVIETDEVTEIIAENQLIDGTLRINDEDVEMQEVPTLNGHDDQQEEHAVLETQEGEPGTKEEGTIEKDEPAAKPEIATKERKPDAKEEVAMEEGEPAPDTKTDTKADPDAENISEDELQTGEDGVKVVPEAEEVSDEELPGPKRAELPADTEVVSEDELPAVKKGAAGTGKRKITEGDYDPGSPTSENEGPTKKPALSEQGHKEEDEEPEKPKKLPELDKYWKAVNDDPTDFTGWTYLLQYVDQENDMEAAREAYDAFLSHYPYCYGYWRKYADYEKRKGNKKKCEEVFERGLRAIPLSVDLWIHYITYVRASCVRTPVAADDAAPPTTATAATTAPPTTATTTPEDDENVRVQFERSLAACGLEFRSDRLWEHYIKWETSGKRLQNAMRLYERLLVTPTQGYVQHFENFQEHVMSNPPNKILEVDEFLALRKEVKTAIRVDAVEEVDNPDVPPGEDEKELNSDEETKAIRDRIVSIRRKMHKGTVTAVQARWNYEEGIKRPYFHVKPLERCQLKNWQDYLDYEIEQGDKDRIIVLFERCLIACALYEEFWLRFVNYLNGLKDAELQQKIKDVFERACTIHHLKKPVIHLQWAMFEESIKNYNKAAEILQNLDKTVPNILQVAYRRINLERRRNDYEKCSQLYEQYINNSKNKSISTNLAIKYARFLVKVSKNHDKAVEVLNGAVTKDPNNSRLYLQLIDLSMHKNPIVEAEVLEHINAFLEKDGTEVDQKLTFAQRKLEFLEDFGSDISLVQQAYEDYQKYLKLAKDKKKDSSKSDQSKKDKSPSSASTAPSASAAPLPSSGSNYGHHGNYSYQQSNTATQYQYQQHQQQQQQQPQQQQQQPPQAGQYGAGGGGAGYAQGAYSQGGDQYQQYGGWQYPQTGYAGYNQWGNYSGGYGY